MFLSEVEATGFEPAASASRTQRSTKLSHASIFFASRNSRLAKVIIFTFLCFVNI